MKRTWAIPIFAAVSILMASLSTVVAPVLDLACGEDPGHFVISIRGEASHPMGTVPVAQSNICDHGTAPGQPEGQGHDNGTTIHVHGMDSHALPGSTLAPVALGAMSFTLVSTVKRLSDTTVRLPTKPPRFSFPHFYA
jgi:hypothetical protein